MKIVKKCHRFFEGKLMQIRATEHGIDLQPGTKPVRQLLYRVGLDKGEEIRKNVEYQLNAGVMDPAFTKWASQVLVVPKKDGKMRFSIEFSRLNDVKIPGVYLLPPMEDFINNLGEEKVSTMLHGFDSIGKYGSPKKIATGQQSRATWALTDTNVFHLGCAMHHHPSSRRWKLSCPKLGGACASFTWTPS